MIGMEFHQPLRMILLQETGWQLNSQWEANGWYIIHSSGHSLAARSEFERPGSWRISFPAIEVGRKRHYTIYIDEDALGQPSEISVSNCYIPTITQMICGIMTANLFNDGNMCYINSVLPAQVWINI